MDVTTLQLFKDAFSLFREGIGAVRDAKSLLPAAQQKTVDETLERAGNAASLAEAQIAQSLGYRLRKCTFPPQIMLTVQTPHGPESQCPKCKYTTQNNRPQPPRSAIRDDRI